MKHILALMTCYNRVNTTLDCLRCLFAQRLPQECRLDVFLVDDASPDKTGLRVCEKFPQVHVIQGKGELFWSQGMRLAWDAAVATGIPKVTDETFFLWLNDDVLLKTDAIAGLLVDYARVKSVVVGTFSTDVTECCISYGATRYFPDGKEPRPADKMMNGNLVLVPYDVYKVVGPIYGGYHHQYGDYDYGLLLRRKGFEFYASSKFCGICPEQPERYFHLKDRSLTDRWKLLFNPKGFSLHDTFLYRYRNWGVIRALLSIMHVIVIVTFALEKTR